MTAVIGSVGATLPNKGNTACMYRAALLQSPKSSISVTEQQNPAYKTTRTNTGTACSAGHTDRIYFGGERRGERGGCLTPMLMYFILLHSTCQCLRLGCCLVIVHTEIAWERHIIGAECKEECR